MRVSSWAFAILATGVVTAEPVRAPESGSGLRDTEALVAMVNAYREEPATCEGRTAGPSPALSADRRLARLGVGPKPDPLSATRQTGYTPSNVQIINFSGPDGPDAAMTLLAERYCRVLRDADFQDIGVAREGASWQVVLARPLLDADLAGWQEAGREIVEEINKARSRSRTCGSQRHEAASPLRWNEQLAQAALGHGRDMAARNYFSHVSRDGGTLSQRVDQAGYAWTRVGENIAAGSGSPAQTVAGWLDSPSHCATLMNPDFFETGAAYAIGEDSDAVIYWVQVFAAPE